MSADRVKIRLRRNELEIEYEGRESFLVSDLSKVLGGMSELLAEQGAAPVPGPSPNVGEVVDPGQKSTPQPSNRAISATTQILASRMQVDSGPKLTLAAIAHLVFVGEKETFTRAEILAEMREATRYYRKTYSVNLNRTLGGFVEKGRLNERETGTYALSASEREQIETTLRDAELL